MVFMLKKLRLARRGRGPGAIGYLLACILSIRTGQSKNLGGKLIEAMSESVDVATETKRRVRKD